MCACGHAVSHENGSKRVRHRFGCHFGILPFQTEEEKEEDIQGSVHPILQKRHIYGKYHHLLKELHFHPYKYHHVKPGPSSTKTKKTDWFTRNSSCDHHLKIRSRGNPATFHTTQFPASFVVAFGRNSFIQIAYTQSNANAEELNLVKHSLRSPKQFALGKRSCPTTHLLIQDWPKICADDTGCGSSEVAAAGWKEAHTGVHSGCVVKLLLTK